MSVTVAFANLGFLRRPSAHFADVRAMRAEGAQIIATVENRTAEVSRRTRGHHRERLQILGRLQWERRGSFRAALDRRGYRIGWRRIVWAAVDLSGIGTVLVVVVHMPPRRMPRLVPLYALRLHRFLRRSRHPWIVAGDWNHMLHNDPTGLRARFGARWYGTNKGDRRDGPGTIDGFAVHPDLVPCVLAYRQINQHRPDGHPWCLLTLSARAR